jgi:signal transduction histidine kinase
MHRRITSDPGSSALVRVVTLRWAAGIFCALLAVIMLALPDGLARFPWAGFPAWGGPVFLLAGGGLLGAAVFPLPPIVIVLVHLMAGSGLLALARGFAAAGVWPAVLNCGLMGAALLCAPALSRGPRRPAEGSRDLLAIVLAVTGAATGVALLAAPRAFGVAVYALTAAQALGFAAAFLTTGGGLLLSTRAALPPRAANVLHLTAAGTFLAFMVLVPLPAHAWTRVAYYLVFGIALAVIPWAEPSLARAEGASLRVRFVVALAAAMTLAMVAPAAIIGDWEESAATRQVVETQTMAAGWAAEALQDAIADVEAAAAALAAVPGLVAMPAPAREPLLRTVAAGYPDARAFVVLDGSGQVVARSDGRPSPRGPSPIFARVRQSDGPVLEATVARVLRRPTLEIAVPIRGPDGGLAGAVGAAMETSAMFSKLARSAGRLGDTMVLVDGRGRALASWDNRLAPFADLSALPPVAAMLRGPGGSGALVYTGPDGDQLAGYARLPRLGWGVVVQRPAAGAFAAARSGRELSFLVHVAMMLVAGIAGTLAAAGLARPLEALAREAGNLGEGAAPGTLPRSSVPEIARLSEAFERMQSRLAARTAEREAAEKGLRRQARDLARSNAQLEEFAYVASHDLQEPLRMIKSYLELFARRYAGRLDADADQFIAYAVDGATRMQHLISDLLAYSRVGTAAAPMAPVDCDTVLAQALNDLKVAMDESGAVVTHDPLPAVVGDGGQLRQVFENLIGNAIKFRNAAPPRVHISAARTGDEWTLRVRDNGIGIAPEHAGRIFAIFQRLHTRDEYPGTGIGLTICKKIVERHGGRIWVDSAEGRGATFAFTLPARGGPGSAGDG